MQTEKVFSTSKRRLPARMISRWIAPVRRATSSSRRLQCAFINTGKANCSIFESGAMVADCLAGYPDWEIHYFTLDELDLPYLEHRRKLRLRDGHGGENGRTPPKKIDLWIFNWHFITMASHVRPEVIESLPGPKFTIVLEVLPGEPLKLVPPGVFDGYLVLDPRAEQTATIFPFPRPLPRTAKLPDTAPRDVPVIGSFGFGTPGKGFELLIEAVNRAFDKAVVRINVPPGDYIGTDVIHRTNYAKHLAAMCRRIAKPGVSIDFTFHFMSPDELTMWCGENNLNCFMYTRDQPGLSATTDYAILSGRPLLTSTNSTFQHIHPYVPPYPVTSLQAAINSTRGQVGSMQRDWSRETFRARFREMLVSFRLLEPGASAESPRIQPLRHSAPHVLVAHRGRGDEDNAFNYASRLKAALGRTGAYTVTEARLESRASLLLAYLASDADVIVLLDHPSEEVDAVRDLVQAHGSPLIVAFDGSLVKAGQNDPHGFVRLPHPPIVPYYTVTAGLKDKPAIWLVGFSGDVSNLGQILNRIAVEAPGSQVIIEDSGGRLHGRICEWALSRHHLEIDYVTLQTDGPSVIEAFAGDRLIIVSDDPERREDIEAFCALAMATERPVLFTRSAPVRSFGDRVSYIEDILIPEAIALGVAAQVSVVHDFGEGSVFAAFDAAYRAWRSERASGHAGVGHSVATVGQYGAICAQDLLSLDGAALVSALYRGFLGREPDPSGGGHFTRLIEEGWSKVDVLEAIRTSDEGKERVRELMRGRLPCVATHPDRSLSIAAAWLHGTLNREADRFLEVLYRGFLGREPDPDGRANFLERLSAGLPKVQILEAVRLSTEHLEMIESRRNSVQAIDMRLGWSPTIPEMPPQRELSEKPACNEAPKSAAKTMAKDAKAAQFTFARPASAAAAFIYVDPGDTSGCKLSNELLRSWPQHRYQPYLVTWDADRRAIRLLTAAEAKAADLDLDLTGSAHAYPDEPAKSLILNTSSTAAGDWLLAPSLLAACESADHLQEVDILMEAKRSGLLTACVFHGAGELTDRAAADERSAACERYMQALLLSDLLLPISNRAERDLSDYFSLGQLCTHGPPLVKVSLPWSWQGQSRPLADYARRVVAALVEQADKARLVSQLYYVVPSPERARTPGQDELARALVARGVRLITSTWSPEENRLVPAGFSFPGRNQGDGEPSWVEPGAAFSPRWILLTATFDPETLRRLHRFASERDLHVAAELPELRTDIGRDSADEARQHAEETFSAYALLDKVFVDPSPTGDAFDRYLLSTRRRLTDAENRLETLRRPLDLAGPKRPVVPSFQPPERVRIAVLCDSECSLTMVLDAAVQAQRRVGYPITYQFLVSPAESERNARRIFDHLGRAHATVSIGTEPELAISEAMDSTDVLLVCGSGPASARSVEIAQWWGVPAVVDCGMTAQSSAGTEKVHFAVPGALTAALVKLCDPSWRKTLGEEALASPAWSWEHYANDLLFKLATYRPLESLRALPQADETAPAITFPNLQARPLLSICISTYNRAGWLSLNLRNLFSQLSTSPDEVEVVVVDNASTDNTPDAASPFLSRPDFRYYRNSRNVGMLGNLAVTAQRARGRFIWILGDDDFTRPGAINNVLGAIRKHADVELIYLNYGYTSVSDPLSVVDLNAFLTNYNVLEPSAPDELGTVSSLATKSENFYTAIYSHVYRRDHALRAYCQDTSGRAFSTMLSCIPTAYYVLHFMARSQAYWIGEPALVVNSNVSWAPYGPLFDLEQLPRAWDLAEMMGASPNEVDIRRSNRLWLVEMMWRDIFDKDLAGNSAYFSARRVLSRLKHLPALDQRIPEMKAIYERAREKGHPSARLPSDELFLAWKNQPERRTEMSA